MVTIASTRHSRQKQKKQKQKSKPPQPGFQERYSNNLLQAKLEQNLGQAESFAKNPTSFCSKQSSFRVCLRTVTKLPDSSQLFNTCILESNSTRKHFSSCIVAHRLKISPDYMMRYFPKRKTTPTDPYSGSNLLKQQSISLDPTPFATSSEPRLSSRRHYTRISMLSSGDIHDSHFSWLHTTLVSPYPIVCGVSNRARTCADKPSRFQVHPVNHSGKETSCTGLNSPDNLNNNLNVHATNWK